MWKKIPDIIIKYRLYFMMLIGAITIVMGYFASKVELAYDFARTVPPNDPDMLFFQKFKDEFGEDGNVLAIGMKDSAIYKLENFLALRDLNSDLKKIHGINEVLSIPLMRIIGKDTANSRFFLHELFPKNINSQHELDSILQLANDQKFYNDKLFNQSGATAMLVSIDNEYANSAKRVGMTDSLTMAGKKFEDKTGIKVRYAGLPFVRTVVAEKVRKELSFFLKLSALVTGAIMLLFFRSWRAVIFSMVMIGILVVWTLGTVSLFGYKISMLIGLIPPVIVTIGITNAIYLLNKYHTEYSKHKNKMDAIRVVVRRMGLATFLTNLTVAIGFLTLLYTDIMVMREFGIVAGINIIALFFVSANNSAPANASAPRRARDVSTRRRSSSNSPHKSSAVRT
jgi:predicted RND superfamily exporter protein